MAIRTIFTMAEECSRGERQGWQEFVRDFVPLARDLLQHYFPTLRPDIDVHITAVFRRARADESTWFRQLRFTNDREFQMAFRDLVFGYGRSVERLPVPQVSAEQAREPMQDLTVIERELLWMSVKGYDAPQTAAILMNAESTATAMAKTAEKRLAKLEPGMPAQNGLRRALTDLAETEKSPECVPLKTFNNLINGQISWQDRDRAEQHIRECLYCIDRFTALQEMIWYGRRTQPLGETESEQVLAHLGFGRKHKGMLGRLFPRSA